MNASLSASLESLHVTPLPDRCWDASAGGRRSADITPLYVERFHGRHAGTGATTAHSFWECLCVIKGSITLEMDRRNVALRQGDAVFIPPHVSHIERSTGVTENLWIGLEGARLSVLPGAVMEPVRRRELIETAERLWTRSQCAWGLAGPELDGLALAAFGIYWRAVQAGHEATHEDIDEIVARMRREFATIRSVAEIAAWMHVSEGHFSRMFRARTGRSPLQLLSEIRMQHAMRWLTRSALSVADIARLCGYDDPLYFSRAFRAATGKSPRSFRDAGGA